jgi:hypothetical protein
MRFVLLMLAVIPTAGAARAQNLVPPEIVRLENVQGEGETKIIYVGNAKKHYFLHCNTKAAGCITPEDCMGEVIFAFACAESCNQFSDPSAEIGNGSFSGLAQKCFQFVRSGEYFGR